MTKKHIRKNIQTLRNLRDAKIGKVPSTIQQKINNIVDLYEDRRIVQRATAENLINNISTNDAKKRAKGLKEYDKKVEQYEQSQPASERMKEQLEKARQAKVVKSVKRRITGKTKASAVSRLFREARNRGIGNRKLYSIKFMLYSMDPIGSIVRGKRINNIIYYPMFENGRPREANIRAGEFIETLTNRRVTKQAEKPLFKKKLLMCLKTDQLLLDTMPDMLDYIDAIQLTPVNRIDDDGRPYNIEEEGLKETSNTSIYHFYHETLIDPDKESLKEAIHHNNINDNERWINELLKTYEGTELTRVKRGKLAKTLSRNKILELVNMTEDEIHQYGISINQMKKVFTFFNIPVKLYDFQCQLIYRFEPNNYKHGHKMKIFVAMIKNNHVYPINANQDRLRQLKHETPVELTVSSNFFISDRDEPPKYIMFSNIDELLQMKDQDEYYLIHKENNLNDVLFQFQKVGYEPYIKYQGNRIAEIRARYTDKRTRNVTTHIIKTQDLAVDAIERDVYTEVEDEYKNIVEANFQKAISQHMI